MVKEKYKLRSVLTMRERAREQAARVVASRREQLAEAEVELARRLQAVADCRQRQDAALARMMGEAGQGTQAHNLVAHRQHLSHLKEEEQELLSEVERQRAVLARSEGELEQALDALIEASKETRVIEKHRDDWQSRRRLEEERREQKLTDEAGRIIHGRRSEG